MKKEELLAKLKAPNGSEKLAGEQNILTEVLDLVSGISVSVQKINDPESGLCQALSVLVRLSKQKEANLQIRQQLTDEEFVRFLRSEEGKVRKNAARLIGAVHRESLDSEMACQLQVESIRMVIPSLLLALGTLKTEKARETLEKYQVRPAKDLSEEKHVREEKEALRKALSNFADMEEHKFIGSKGERGASLVELRTGKGLEKALSQEVKDKNAADRVVTVRPGNVIVSGTDWQRLQRVRTWREVLIPLSFVKVSSGVPEREDLGRLAEEAAECMKEMHEGNYPFRFRLETGNRGQAAATAAELERCSEGKLQNSTGTYECEIRLYLGTMQKPFSGKTTAYMKLYTAKDHRFDYRRKSIAASIHPANAAGVMQLALPYLSDHGVILEPCCGSGTMFLERARVENKKPKEIIGMDISAMALQAARENVKAAEAALKGISISLKKSDMLLFDDLKEERGRQADELLANLPFGNRVGNHKINEALYHGLFDKIPQWVKKGGIAVLYSMEGKLLMKEALNSKHLRILQKYRIEAGGLEPMLLILQVC